MDNSKVAASLAAAQDDVARIFEGYDVPEAYRTRLTAYIQCWYLDQGDCGTRICMLPPHEAAGAVRPA